MRLNRGYRHGLPAWHHMNLDIGKVKHKHWHEFRTLAMMLAGSMFLCLSGMSFIAWVTRADSSEEQYVFDSGSSSSQVTLTASWSVLTHGWEDQIRDQQLAMADRGGSKRNYAHTSRQLPSGEGLNLSLSAAEARSAVDLLFEFIRMKLPSEAVNSSRSPDRRKSRLTNAQPSIVSEFDNKEANLLLGLLERVWIAHLVQGDEGWHEDHCSKPKVCSFII